MFYLLLFFLSNYSYPIELINIEEKGKSQYALIKINEEPIDKVCLDYNKTNTDPKNWKIHSTYKVKDNLVRIKLPKDLPNDHYYSFRLYSGKKINWTREFYLDSSNKFTMNLPSENEDTTEEKSKKKKKKETRKSNVLYKPFSSSGDSSYLISIIIVGTLVVFVIASVAITSFCN